jgi:siroheme synthase-like protein
MLVDMNLKDKRVLILGEGNELEIRTRQFLDAGAKVTAVGPKQTRKPAGLRNSSRLTLAARSYRKAWKQLIKTTEPYLVVLATKDQKAATDIAKQIRKKHHVLLYAVDMPQLNDFNMPALARRGSIRVAVSTGGLSPAMAATLRNRIEHIITPEDSREVQLQSKIRQEIKNKIANADARKACIYKILEDRRIKQFLRTGRVDEAQRLAAKQIASFVRKAGS